MPLFVEVQALVAPAGSGPPRRTAAGIDSNRLALLIAVLARRGDIDVSGRDIYASLAGGLSTNEPALDLALALALASSRQDRSLRSDMLVLGEVSLLGEVRPVRGLERRLREAARLGFRRALIPAGPLGISGSDGGAPELRELELLPVATLREALALAFEADAGTSG
jgi:DNA repair protein RadA/Sms